MKKAVFIFSILLLSPLLSATDLVPGLLYLPKNVQVENAPTAKASLVAVSVKKHRIAKAKRPIKNAPPLSEAEQKYEDAKLHLAQIVAEKKEKRRLASVDADKPKEKNLIDKTVEATQQMGEDLLGGKESEIKKYREALDRNDVRKNILDVYFAPAYIYNDSQSNSWFRNYSSSSPGFRLGAKVYISPSLELGSEYKASLGADINDSPTTVDRSAVSHEWFQFSLSKRFFWEDQDRLSHISLGLQYKIYQMKIPADSPHRTGIKVSGVGLGSSFYYGLSEKQKLSAGATIYPFQSTGENNSALAIDSGTLNSSYSVNFWFEWEYLFERRHQVFIRAEAEMEKDVYSDASNQIDPRTGTIINGVSVKNQFFIFSLGYSWGH